MNGQSKTAIVVCVPGDSSASTERSLLGLMVGERLLLALSHAGVERVAFVGDGPRPTSDRASLTEISAGELDLAQSHLVVPGDVVFDRGLLGAPELPSGLPVRRVSGSELGAMLEDPEAALDTFGTGCAGGRQFALRVRDRRSAAQARRALLRSLRKPSDGIVSRALNRHVSIFLTRFLVGTGIRPNVFTVAFMLIGLLAALVVATHPLGLGLIVGAALFQVQSILDGCDGEMARLTYRFSKTGQWLDTIGDDLTNYLFCLGLAVGQADRLGEPSILWLGGAILALQVASSAVCYRRMIAMGTGDLLALPDLVTTAASEGWIASAVSSLRLLFKRDSFVFILATVTVLQQPLLAFYLFAAGTIPVFLGVLANERRIGELEAARSRGLPG